MIRLVKVAVIALTLLVAYLGVTFVQVWLAARRDQARPVQAIVVLGAAQYNGVPSDILRARLDHAHDLYERGLAPVIVVTGGSQPGDRFTEASAAAAYLHTLGVPDDDILREVEGTSSWESLAAAAVFLKERDILRVLLVSDPFHSFRIAAIAEELGLESYTSPTRTSPIAGPSEARHLVRETAAVAVGRVIGYRREAGIQRQIDERRQATLPAAPPPRTGARIAP
jgi:uncharacterized SAM-binding protein YcdF (DUF218 family)